MRPPRILPSLALLAILAGAAGPAKASPPDPRPAPAQEAESADEHAARALSAGNAAFREGRFADAEQAYREAFALKKGYDIAGNLGAAELAQGKLREGAQHLAFTLRLFPLTGDPTLREQMTRAFEQCRQGVGALRIKAAVPGAAVLVDGAPQGEAPLADDVFVDPGEHVIEARLPGFTGSPRRVTVDRGGSVEVDLPLAPVPQKASPPPPPPVKRRSLIGGLGLAAVAAVGLGGGAAFMGLSASRRSDARAQGAVILGHGGSCIAGAGSYDTARCPTLQSTLRADDTFHDVGVGALVLGSAAALGTIAYFVWPQRAPTTTGKTFRVTPVVGAGDGGLLFSGSF